MTPKEAIEELKYDYEQLGKGISCDTGWGIAFNEAYKMAIDALKFLEEYKNTLWCNKISCVGCQINQTECVGYHKKLVSKYERSAIKKAIRLDSLQEEYQQKVQRHIDDLKYYLNTNEKNGVVYIPKFIIEKIINQAVEGSEGE